MVGTKAPERGMLSPLLQGDMWPCLETVLVINHNHGCHRQLLGKEVLQCTGETPTPLGLPGLLSKVLRLRSPVLRIF